MSEGASATRYGSVNSGGIPTSAEELAHKYQRLFQEYSRIKAQHTVLKKAILKEQAVNEELQSKANQKEKELRKAKEELDVLNFHNDRLAKRIQLLQDEKNNSASFGLFGSGARKGSAQSQEALKATHLDLEQKIEENERLHQEIFEINTMYTNHINRLQAEIMELESKQSLIAPNGNGKSDGEVGKQVDLELDVRLDELKSQLQQTEEKLKLSEEAARQKNQMMQQELSILRDILSKKLSDAQESAQLTEKTKKISDEVLVDSVNALRQLEDAAREYLSSLLTEGNSEHPMSAFTMEKVKELDAATETWASQYLVMLQKLDAAQGELSLLKITCTQKDSEKEDARKQVKRLESEIGSLKSQLESHSAIDRARELTAEVKQLNEQIRQQQQDLKAATDELERRPTTLAFEDLQKEILRLKSVTEAKEGESARYPASGKSSQRSSPQPHTSVQDNDTASPIPQQVNNVDVTTDATNDTIVQPIPVGLPRADVIMAQDSLQDEHADRNSRATSPETLDAAEKTASPTHSSPLNIVRVVSPTLGSTTVSFSMAKADMDKGASQVVMQDRYEFTEGSDASHLMKPDYTREILIKRHYEAKINQLVEALQLVDSKNVRFNNALKIFKNKCRTLELEKAAVLRERDDLLNEVAKIKDDLATTESNYQSQLNMMTDYVAQLQQERSSSSPM